MEAAASEFCAIAGEGALQSDAMVLELPADFDQTEPPRAYFNKTGTSSLDTTGVLESFAV